MERLSDYWLFVSNTPFSASETPTTLKARTGTWSAHLTSFPNPWSSIPVNAAGRYIRVQLSGTNNLNAAEVQVFGEFTVTSANLAMGRSASQSSTSMSAGASNAADGNTDGTWAHASVTHTNLDTNAWWQVDLGASASITSVVVWNRTDCCLERLTDYWVFLSDTPFTPTDTPAVLQSRADVWSNHQTATNPSSITILGGGAKGRYVRVQLAGTNYLSLAEVQVFGEFTPSNLAMRKTAAQSSTSMGAAAANAVDGNTDGNWARGSVTHTNLDTNAWWQVDLGLSATVKTVIVWNRSDCCMERMNDYWVFVSDTPFLASDTPAVLQSRPGVWSSHQSSSPTPSASIPVNAAGRYVRVQLGGANFLHLAEVQVLGTPQ